MKKRILYFVALFVILMFPTKLLADNGIGMYRLYNPNSGEHFYTASIGERDFLINVGWKYEGGAWTAPTNGEDVYRLYNPNAGDHHYTTSKAEKDMLVKVGWKYEGVGWKSGGSSKVYRLYNPNAKGAGAHHYTLSKGEYDFLVKKGWKGEGVGWYADDTFEPDVILTTKTETKKEILKYNTITKDDSNLYKGETKVEIKGQDGYIETTYKITYKNGIESRRQKVDENKKDAVNEIILRGTKDKITTKTETAKENASSTIKAMKFLQSNQKDEFIAQISSAKDLAVLNSIVDAAKAQDKIESQKGTVKFNIVGLDGQTVDVVERRIVEGAYAVTLKDLGLAYYNIIFVSGDLTGTVKAQENKISQINIIDTTKVQTIIIEARDVETGKTIKSMTTYSAAGKQFTPSYSQLELSTDEWRIVNNNTYDIQTAKAGVTSQYTFDVRAFKPMLDKSQTIIAQQELVRLINEYRVTSGLTALATDSKLDEASAIRAKEIKESFEHVRPNGSSFSSVLTQVGYTGYRAAGENIASFSGFGSITGIQAANFLFDQWRNSPGHNENMLRPSYTHVSFGVYTDEESVYGATIFTQ